MTKRARPLSPHLQVYRPQITSALSIFHRGTGVLLAIGALGLICWLFALVSGPAEYARFEACAGSLPGRIVLIAITAALCYHFFNGLRHLVWDTGRGFGAQGPRKREQPKGAFASLKYTLATVFWYRLLGAGLDKDSDNDDVTRSGRLVILLALAATLAIVCAGLKNGGA